MGPCTPEFLGGRAGFPPTSHVVDLAEALAGSASALGTLRALSVDVAASVQAEVRGDGGWGDDDPVFEERCLDSLLYAVVRREDDTLLGDT